MPRTTKAERRIDSETGEEVVIGRDGRKMNPKSLANVGNPETGFGAHPENITPRKPSQLKIFKQALTDVLQEEISPTDKTKKITAVCEKMVDTYLNTKNENTVKQLSELISNIVDGIRTDKGDHTEIHANKIQIVKLPELRRIEEAEVTDYELE
jgi:hypothetical protein